MSASLRDIAADAEVNIGLIHRHLGNKDDLLRQVLAAQAQAGAALVEEARDPATALEWMFTHVGRGGDYTRMVAWLLLSGRHRDFQQEYPTIAALRAQLGPDGDSVPLLGAMAMLYGWTVFGDQLLDAFETSVDERPGLERQLARLAADMLHPTQP
jgi:AcrR family transcriptional regulator